MNWGPLRNKERESTVKRRVKLVVFLLPNFVRPCELDKLVRFFFDHEHLIELDVSLSHSAVSNQCLIHLVHHGYLKHATIVLVIKQLIHRVLKPFVVVLESLALVVLLTHHIGRVDAVLLDECPEALNLNALYLLLKVFLRLPRFLKQALPDFVSDHDHVFWGLLDESMVLGLA